jgi:cytochrome c-type biogenesis protein CcmE
MTRRQRRLTLIGVAGLVLFVAAGLVLYALSDRIVFFNSPTDIVEKQIPAGTRIRLGGLVTAGSLLKQDDGHVRFDVSDGKTTIAVSYQGILPDLFREGQGVVAEGVIAPDMSFAADTVLAKHDERYMAPEVVEALKKAGRWKEGEDTVNGSTAADGPPMQLQTPAAP